MVVGTNGSSNHLKIVETGIKALTEKFGSVAVSDIPKITSDIKVVDISELNEPLKEVSIQARIDSSREQKNNSFLVLRNENHQTLQGIIWGNKPLVEYVSKNLSKESVVIAHGELVKAYQTVKSCTVQDLELQISRLYCIGPNYLCDEKQMVYQDLLHPENSSNSLATSLSKKLDNRILDLRTPVNHLIFRMVSKISNYMREFLLKEDFVEVYLPKLIGAASEDGSEFFKLKYFETEAYLAQSPQLYKQMLICADFSKVFSVGPVFRAENSNTHRHLCEYTGFDLEMSFKNHYHEAMLKIDEVFRYVFEKMFSECKDEIKKIQEFFGIVNDEFKFATPTKIIHYKEAISLLNEAGVELGQFEDINTTNEKLLGKIVREKFDTDYFIVDKFPLANRAFYTMSDTDDIGSGYGNSYDFFVRGEEVMSGAQRISDSELLKQALNERGIDATPLKSYIESIASGVPRHAGGGIGLDRVAMLTLGLNNIRRVVLFPRDPSRLEP